MTNQGSSLTASARPLVIIPAYNEEESIGPLLDELRSEFPDADPVVISDGSADRTAAVARARGAVVLDLPCNLGVGGAVQAGLRYAYACGAPYVVRIDGDGQHPPSEIRRLVDAQCAGDADLMIGTRFGAGSDSYRTPWHRQAGIRALGWFLSRICRARVTDPTSGFWLVRRGLLRYFAHSYPTEYPEPEALALLRRQGYSYCETPVTFRPRRFGRSTINGWGTIYFALKVGLAIVIDRIGPIDPRFARNAEKESAS